MSLTLAFQINQAGTILCVNTYYFIWKSNMCKNAHSFFKHSLCAFTKLIIKYYENIVKMSPGRVLPVWNLQGFIRQDTQQGNKTMSICILYFNNPIINIWLHLQNTLKFQICSIVLIKEQTKQKQFSLQ